MRCRYRWHVILPKEPLGVFVRELDTSVSVSERGGPGYQFRGMQPCQSSRPTSSEHFGSPTDHSPSMAADALRFNNAAVISSNDDLACSHAGFPIDSPTEREYRAPASR